MSVGFIAEADAVTWCRKVIGLKGAHGLCRAVSAVDDEGFLAVVVMSNFTRRNVDLHVASRPGKCSVPEAVRIELFQFVFSYVFKQLGAVRTTGLIKAGNKKARRLVERLGFSLEGVMRKALDDDDLCVYGFLNTDYAVHKWST